MRAWTAIRRVRQQPLNNVAPRGGFAYSMTEKTVIRGGYGLYWVPPITDIAEATIGARGYSASTTFLSSTDGGLTPVGTLSNPFPAGITEPQGNSLGLATGAGSVIDFVDQDSKPGYVQQYSLDLQRELPGEMAIAVGYMGSRSERLPIGGTVDATVNINQLDPQYQALGTALQQTVPNPFFGNPAFGNLSRSATIARGQLLRPFPQFDNVLMHRVNLAQRPLQRAGHALDQADDERLRARHQPHLQPPRGQPVRREQHVLEPPARRAEQLRPRRASTACRCSTSRTG